MMRYIIVDDESIAHEIIKGYCDLLPNLELVASCYDAIEALEVVSKENIDLMFLDLNMPKLKGFDFLKTLSAPPRVIVTTAYKEHALEGFELNVVDYLLKPFGFERFVQAINKVLLQQESGQVLSKNILEDSLSPKSFFLRSDHRYVQVNAAQIRYIEASGNYCKIFTESDVFTIRERISALTDQLKDIGLIRVHKSFLVVPTYIHSIEGNRIFIGEHTIPIGKMYRQNVLALLGK